MQSGPGSLGLVMGDCGVVVGRWGNCCQSTGWLRRAGECVFRVEAVIHFPFSLSFPVQGVIMDSNIHHFS